MKGRWDITPTSTGHTGRNLRVRFTSGKHDGFETVIPDIPFVTIRHADRPQLITVVLPGLTGDALILGEPQEN